MHRTDLFVEVTNLTEGNTVWAYFTATGYFPTNIHISRQIPKESVFIETCCLCFKKMHIDWENTVVTGISGTVIEMPSKAKISVFMDNDLTNINNDYFQVNLVVRLLNQIFVVPPPWLPPRYDDAPPPAAMALPQPSTSTAPSAPPHPSAST